MGWGRQMRQMAQNWFDLPTEITNEEPRLEWIGNTNLHIENHLGIELYRPEEVRLQTKNGKLTIRGQQLKIESINAYEVRVLGRIESVSYRQ